MEKAMIPICPKTRLHCTNGCSRTPAGVVTHCRARTLDDPGRSWPEADTPVMPVIDFDEMSDVRSDER
jgi:hypothetical protein